MNNWVMGFDGFIGALLEGGDAVQNIRRGRTVDEDCGETGGGYIDIEVESGLVVSMRKIKAEDEGYSGLDEL